MVKRTLCRLPTLLLLLTLLLPSSTGAQERTLYVFGKGGAGDFDNNYLAQLDPDFHWSGIDVSGNNSAQSMALQMQTQNDCFDLYAVGYAYCGLETLREKGFCLDLSPYPELVEIIKRMHPYIRDAVYEGDTLFAMPISVSVSGWAYDRRIADAMGLEADDMPTTYASFIEFADWWVREGAELYPEYCLYLGPSDTRRHLISTVIDDYIHFCTLHQLDIDFTRPILTDVLRGIDALDTDALDELIRYTTYGIDYAPSGLFQPSYNYSNLSDMNAEACVPLHLGFDETDTLFPADLYCFAVNPATANADMAVRYMATFYKNMDMDKRISLFADDSVFPVEYPDYQQALEANAQAIAALRAKEDAEDFDAAETLEQLELERASIEASRWLITPGQLADYQRLTSSIAVRPQSLLERNSTDGTLEIQSLIAQYADRRLTLEPFVSQANQIVRMILEEE